MGMICVIIFSIFFWYSLVFAWTWIFDYSTKVEYKLSENVYLYTSELSKTKILFKSGEDISKYKIKSECSIFSKLTYKKWNSYLFDLKFFDNKCIDKNFILVDEKNEIKLQFNINPISESTILTKMLDLKTEELTRLQASLNRKISAYSKYSTYDKDIEANYYTYLYNNRALQEAKYNLWVISNIIIKRSEKYIVPVEWRVMPNQHVRLPNTARPYREEYTDWIHHGWDIYGNFWEQVRALDDWIIVRTVSEFDFSDLSKIKKSKSLSEDDLIRNLDILRWKQVWLKTMKWDVIFYAHLNDVIANLQVWDVVKKWQPLWTIWITWVPDQSYTDYHLHFEVQKNPFSLEKWQSYDVDDYLKWDWLLEWKSEDYILEHQLDYFQN